MPGGVLRVSDSVPGNGHGKHSMIAGITVGGVVITWIIGIVRLACIACTVASSTLFGGVAKAEVTDACWVQIGVPCGRNIAVFVKARCLDWRGRGRRCGHELFHSGRGDPRGVTVTLIQVQSGIRNDIKH